MDYHPPSRHEADPDLETLHDTVTPWMIEPLVRWLEPFLVARDDLGESSPILDFIEALEMNLQLLTPIGRRDPVSDVRTRMNADPGFGIMAISYVLSTMSVSRTDEHTVTNTRLPALDKLLRDSRSAWEVTELDVQDGIEGEKQFALTRRDLVAAKLAISDVRAQEARAGAFLADAWNAIATTEPRPSEAYDKAVKAVEVAAQPVVLPNNQNARLGQIIAAMNDKSSKWEFALGDLDLVIEMTSRIWTNHFRHGTQPRGDNTPEEADAALHLAIPLVRFFVGGLVKPSEGAEP